MFSAAEYDWKQNAVAVSISGLEQLINSGEEQFIDLLEARVGNAERTMKNQMGKAVYGDGTAGGGKAIGGSALLVLWCRSAISIEPIGLSGEISRLRGR